MPSRSAAADADTYTALRALHFDCFRYSVRAAAACALGDDVVLWCHAIAHQLCLTHPANQCLIAAAQRHIAAKSQQQQQAACTQKAWDAPAGAQHRHTDRAQSGGLMSSSNDSSDLDAEAAAAQTLTQPNSIAMEGVVVQTRGASSGAGGSTHAVPAEQQTTEVSAGRMGDTSRAPQEAGGGPAYDKHVDAMDDDGNVVETNALIAGGVGNDDGDTHVGLEQDAEEVHAEQLKGIDKADSCQLAPSSQAAGYDQQLQPGHQPGVSQRPCISQQAGVSQQAGISQQENCNQNASRSQQQCNAGPKVVALQGRLHLQKSCQKMQATLQVAFCFTLYHCAWPEA